MAIRFRFGLALDLAPPNSILPGSVLLVGTNGSGSVCTHAHYCAFVILETANLQASEENTFDTKIYEGSVDQKSCNTSSCKPPMWHGFYNSYLATVIQPLLG